MVPRILNLGTRWSRVVSFTLRLLYHQGKSPWYPLHRSLREPQTRSGRSGEERNSQTLPGLETPIIQPVAQRYATDLSRPRFPLYLLEHKIRREMFRTKDTDFNYIYILCYLQILYMKSFLTGLVNFKS
jgi:hypothetical protein